MDTIRETQEQLARLHFSLDKDLSTIKYDLQTETKLFLDFLFLLSIESDECQKKANENMSCLMQKVNFQKKKDLDLILINLFILVTKINRRNVILN